MQLTLECELPKSHSLFTNTSLNSDLSINMSVFIENSWECGSVVQCLPSTHENLGSYSQQCQRKINFY